MTIESPATSAPSLTFSPTKVFSEKLEVSAARGHFAVPRSYLNACSMGLPTVEMTAAAVEDARLWSEGKVSPATYAVIVDRTRELYARLVNVPATQVAIGSQSSVMAGQIAASLPAGAEVLCVEGEFSSMVFPFLVQQERGLRVRHVPLERLAEEITESTHLVSFSLVQSATGQIADVDAIVLAARNAGALTLCDTTQAAGNMPVDASLFDATICNAYKWLLCPRGVAFMTVSPEFTRALTPINAGWYAGDDLWSSMYGPEMALATDARCFDVSPAWPSWVGAEKALDFILRFDMAEIQQWNVGLANAFCRGIGIPEQNQSIVTWADPGGTALAALGQAGILASGRAERIRVAFHIWNDQIDVDAAIAALQG